MNAGFGIVLAAALAALASAALASQASAQSLRGDRYEMVNVQQYQNTSFGAAARGYYPGHDMRGYYPGTFLPRHRHYPAANDVIILDKRSGELWAWSNSIASVIYLGQIYPLGGAGSLARIIQVKPDEKAR